ncbi:MAG: hypothetical protein N5P05_004484 (plasmid) [Chroococcopsis gigantea SAG 12.99]|nr:hypothetical protein [Chroococcopsis gigantea SAG 12.99]
MRDTKVRLNYKTFAELCRFRSHYEDILPDVTRKAQPLIVWYIDCLTEEIANRRARAANAGSRKTVRVRF